MTEADWLAGTDPGPMLEYLRGAGSAPERRWYHRLLRRAPPPPVRPLVSDRKLRLFAIACCRWVPRVLGAPGAPEYLAGYCKRLAVELAERVADGAADWGELESGIQMYDHASYDVWVVHCALAADALQGAVEASFHAPRWVAPDRLQAREALARMLRDIAGCPIRPTPVVEPCWLAWNDGTVRKLASAAYEERRMPEGTLNPKRLQVLADALEDAGCSDASLLGHLRSAGPHVRGCWAVDLLTGRA